MLSQLDLDSKGQRSNSYIKVKVVAEFWIFFLNLQQYISALVPVHAQKQILGMHILW